ncbi:chloramphenicol-biosynthetic FADH2-dependent halogenase CmlS [Kitasatospora sp. NPDC058162]|uniref:chloramphenicol-biosynthetic FADH2-dependent halogenase CmlS n=1 Tax=Kitasatospora sp. NPDC058162 TaxID=3346362 RepID=UPI0036DD3B6D
MNQQRVAIIGAGPTGCTAALTLNRLGHEAVVFERGDFPRYRIGESFLPGSLSLFNRLGLEEKIEEAGFVKKPSATFLWGKGEVPWTFSFSTPRTAPWVLDHAIQVDRKVFDQMLVDEVRERGIPVHMDTPVTTVDVSDPDRVTVGYRLDGENLEDSFDYVIDAGGSGGPLARQLKKRRYDEYFRSFAIWSYFKKADPFEGDLKGTTYSITFEDGWVWMIPLKGDLYSVGLVVDRSKADEVKERGFEEFYTSTLAKADRAMAILDGAERCDEVRIVHDWSYDSELYSSGRWFLSGDSAAFTDPLFSQGVQMATQSAVSAAAAIDRISTHGEEAEVVHDWYNRAYRETYEKYHEFLSAFYTMASFSEPDSAFWANRRIQDTDDSRVERRRWFDMLVNSEDTTGQSAEEFRDRASTMMSIGRHQRPELSSEFSDDELIPARVRWVADLNKALRSIQRLEWVGQEVLLKPYYKIDPVEFRLLPKQVLANEAGRDMPKWTVDERHQQILQRMQREGIGFKELESALSNAERSEVSSQIIIRLFEAGLLRGFDKNGERVVIQARLRFDGVGTEYEI